MTASLTFLNQTPVKEGIKNTLGCITFFGGLSALYALSRTSHKKESTLWGYSRQTVRFLLTLSIVLSCIASRPGLFISGLISHQIATPQTWTGVFGPNTIFAINPWHPRHLLHITANLLSATALIQGVFNLYLTPQEQLQGIILLGIFNFLTGRLVLHLANDAWLSVMNLRRT